MAPPITTAIVSDDNPQTYEDLHVHSVYDEIAPHFSSTRYKAWPIIAQFLDNIPTGWVGLDSGTGNGKYLPLPLDRPGSIWTVGLDRSHNLLQIARTAGGDGTIREVVWGDVLGRPWRNGAFDYAISIATIHHLSTYERRRTAVQRLIQSISPKHGRVLIYVWAIEQDDLSKRSIPKSGQVETVDGCDVFVPWVLSSQSGGKDKNPKTGKNQAKLHTEESHQDEPPKVFNRYYHMFARGELTELVHDAAKGLGIPVGRQLEDAVGEGIAIVQDGWERSNYYVELRRWQAQ